MFRNFVAATAFAVLAAPAFAQCLTHDDLTHGVQVGFASGDRTTSRRLTDGSMRIVEYYVNGNPAKQYRGQYGIYFTEEFELGAGNVAVPGTLIQISFPFDPMLLPRPLPGLSWTGQTVNIFDDGTSRPETTTISFSETPDVTLSGCTYDALLADLRYDWGAAGGLTLQYIYLPEVEIAYILNNQFDGGEMSIAQAQTLTLLSK